MPISIQRETDNTYIMQLRGVAQRSEFDAGQSTIAQEIDAGARPRVLAVLEDFAGWEKDADWNDLYFQLSHGKEIAKIAIVGEPRWEPEALAFAGAGFRRAPVKFFPTSQVAEARAWLAE